MDSIKRCVKNIDKKKAFEMVLGIIGINISFLVIGIVYEKITNQQYKNTRTGALQYFRSGAGFAMIERGTNWLFADAYKCAFIPKQKQVKIPSKLSAIAASTIYISIVAQTQAMFLVSYPFIIMAKSCSLISVILVGVFCSRVRSKQLKLGANKIIVATIVTIGIIAFKLFDPSFDFNNQRKTQLIGLALLFASLFADGFTPDFQAQIKQKYKPEPMIMLIQINKWITYICAIHLMITGQFINVFVFFWQHPECTVDMLIISVASEVGQIFVYRMIREFKQHIVPFVVATRKIITVALSLIYFNHATSLGQISAIIIVFVATLYEFLDNIMKTPAAPILPAVVQMRQQIPQNLSTQGNSKSAEYNFKELTQQENADRSIATQDHVQIQKNYYQGKTKNPNGENNQNEQNNQ